MGAFVAPGYSFSIHGGTRGSNHVSLTLSVRGRAAVDENFAYADGVRRRNRGLTRRWMSPFAVPTDCAPRALRRREGGVTELTLKYLGATPAVVEVQGKRQCVCTCNVAPAKPSFCRHKNGKLGKEVSILVNGEAHVAIHTIVKADCPGALSVTSR